MTKTYTLHLPRYRPPTLNQLMRGTLRRRMHLSKECHDIIGGYWLRDRLPLARGRRRVSIKVTLPPRGPGVGCRGDDTVTKNNQQEDDASRAERYRDMLLRIASRAEDYSPSDIRAHVADALGMTVNDLEVLLRFTSDL